MIKRLVNYLLLKLGKKNHSLDENISVLNIIFILFHRFIALLRGLLFKIFFKKSGITFISRHTKLRNCNHISLGNIVTIEERVSINGLTKQGIHIGNNVTLKEGVIIDSGLINNIGEGLFVGDNVGISQNCFLQASGKLSIGNNVIIGPGTKIFTENHNFDDLNSFINTQGVKRADVSIESGAWIGSNVVVLMGVTIGAGSIVAAGSVVNKDIEANTIYGGIPARKISTRIRNS